MRKYQLFIVLILFYQGIYGQEKGEIIPSIEHIKKVKRFYELLCQKDNISYYDYTMFFNPNASSLGLVQTDTFKIHGSQKEWEKIAKEVPSESFEIIRKNKELFLPKNTIEYEKNTFIALENVGTIVIDGHEIYTTLIEVILRDGNDKYRSIFFSINNEYPYNDFGVPKNIELWGIYDKNNNSILDSLANEYL